MTPARIAQGLKLTDNPDRRGSMQTSFPRVTVAILSWNRLHYLKATLESARQCLQYPNIEWIVLDNCSVEPGLREYLEAQTWLDHLIFLRSSHVEAMNTIVGKATGDVLLLWPEDVQFIVEGDWLQDCVQLLMAHEWLGSMGLNALRRVTIANLFSIRRLKRWRDMHVEWSHFGRKFRQHRRVLSPAGLPFATYGWCTDGVIGSGIPSLTRMDVWRRMGPWVQATKTRGSDLIDSSLGGETAMLSAWWQSGIAWQRAIPIVPVAADILTDPTGTKAKVRGDKRYGRYVPSVDGSFYYRIKKQTELSGLRGRRLPVCFEEFVEPVGFELPLDASGALLKTAINTSIVETI